MDGVLGFLIEFVVTFLVVYLIYFLVIIRKNKKFDPNRVPVEVNLILMKHKINMKKINYRKMLVLVSLVSSFNIALIVTLVFRYVENVFLCILFSLLILVPLSLFGYNEIGKYFSNVKEIEVVDVDKNKKLSKKVKKNNDFSNKGNEEKKKKAKKK